ncbi:hypothetical protein HDU86_001037 [Geranomyces michiganensis]|nr:hypothetical protein HDU86_001037 [Geranomyces michiganensis]
MTYIAVTRNAEGLFEYELVLNSNATCNLCNQVATPPGQKAYLQVSPDGTLGALIETKPYDFRLCEKMTYIEKQIWTDPYRFTNGAMGISLVTPIYCKVTPGAIAGAFHLDLTIEPMSLFLKNMVLHEGGFATLVTPDNRLLATSSDETLVDSAGSLISAFKSKDAFTNRTIGLVVQSQTGGKSECNNHR